MGYRLLLVALIPYMMGILVGNKLIWTPVTIGFVFGIFSHKLAKWIAEGR